MAKFKGKVVRSDLEGGFWTLEADDGDDLQARGRRRDLLQGGRAGRDRGRGRRGRDGHRLRRAGAEGQEVQDPLLADLRSRPAMLRAPSCGASHAFRAQAHLRRAGRRGDRGDGRPELPRVHEAEHEDDERHQARRSQGGGRPARVAAALRAGADHQEGRARRRFRPRRWRSFRSRARSRAQAARRSRTSPSTRR